MNKTDIEYLDYSYNPIAMRCTPVSEGCANCWHLRMADRLAKNPKLPSEERAAYAGEGPPVLKQRELEAPLRLKKPSVIGLQFMGDVGHESVDYTHLTQIFNMMQTCNNHIFLALTKRPQVIATFMDWWLYPYRESNLSIDTVLPNVWWGVTVENQDTMWRIEEMFKIPAARYWISLEPLLGQVDLRPYIPIGIAPVGERPNGAKYGTLREVDFITLKDKPVLGGVVVGGESGPKARPMPIDAARDTRDACVETGTPYTFKQHGEWLHDSELDRHIESKFVGVPIGFAEFALDRVRQEQKSYIWPDGSKSYWLGKKGTSRLLDGKVWNQFPWDVLGESEDE